MKVKFKGEEIEVKECKGIKKLTGLMFKGSSTEVLLFDFKKQTKQAIHSFFCPKFLAVWIKDNKVVGLKIVNPNKININPGKPFNKLIEIPVNKKHSKIIKLFLEDRKKDLNTISSIN